MHLTAEQCERLIVLDRAHGIQELLRGLAHDIRNSLQVVALASQLGDAERTPDIEFRVDQAIDEMNRSLELLGSLGRPVPEGPATISTTDLVALLERIAGHQRNLPACPVRFGPVPKATLAIPAAVGLQIVGNLIANAKEAAPNGSIEIGLSLRDGMVELTVEDAGPGLPVEAGEPLASTRAAGSHGGTGLFAARHLAGRHGGTLDWSARAGGGSRVRVRLPTA
jgi:signal transduction histidine kinase